MAADPELTTMTLTGDPVVEEATRRFKRCVEWEAMARQNFLEDYKFAHGDSYNGYQWPNRIRQNRDLDARPCLTMNVVRQHNLQIKNEALQNKSSVSFQPFGGAATKQSADLISAMFRRVEYLSDAQAAYETACGYQIDGGIGWIRLVTEYEDNNSFNQDVRIKRVWDPLSVYGDPDAQEKNGSDGKFGFVFDLVPNEALEEAYPGVKDMLEGVAPLGSASQEDSWNIKDHTRVCEYFRKVPKKDQLLSFIDPRTGQRAELKKSLMPEEVYRDIKALPLTKWRDITEDEVQWFLIVGQKRVDKTVWPGKYIPLIRVVGEETIVEGVLDRKGHTRSMLDPQRMYNYNSSAQVEFGALQSKTPWIAAAKAIEEYESMWNTANLVNHSVLIYNHVDDEGNPVAPPARTQPPVSSPLFEAGMQTAFNQMMMTSGQWQNQMGMGGNERTGEAISRRQEQGYTAVFHFQNNFAEALKFLGKQFLDLIPKVYDTKRLLKIKAEDGEQFDIHLDPGARQALQEQLDQDGAVVSRVLNPKLGQYDVESDVGPAYGTRREETVKAMTLLLTQAPTLVGLIGDLLLGAMNFKEADEAASRMKRMVPAQALGKGPTQQEQILTKANTSLQAALSKTLQLESKNQLKLAGKDELRDIEVYDAETKRMTALSKQLPLDSEGLGKMIHQLVGDSLQTHLQPMVEKAQGEDGETPDLSGTETRDHISGQEPSPMPGAKKAPDGQWYVADPSRAGKFLRVNPGAGTGTG